MNKIILISVIFWNQLAFSESSSSKKEFRYVVSPVFVYSKYSTSLFLENAVTPIDHGLTDQVDKITFQGTNTISEHQSFGLDFKIYMPNLPLYGGARFLVYKDAFSYTSNPEPRYKTTMDLSYNVKEISLFGGYVTEFYEDNFFIFGTDALFGFGTVQTKMDILSDDATKFTTKENFASPLTTFGIKVHGGYEFLYSDYLLSTGLMLGFERFSLSGKHFKIDSGTTLSTNLYLAIGYMF